MEGLGFLGRFENEMIGKSVYMIVGKKESERLKVFDMGNENTPRFILDWLALNYFINLSDVVMISVVFM